MCQHVGAILIQYDLANLQNSWTVAWDQIRHDWRSRRLLLQQARAAPDPGTRLSFPQKTDRKGCGKQPRLGGDIAANIHQATAELQAAQAQEAELTSQLRDLEQRMAYLDNEKRTIVASMHRANQQKHLVSSQMATLASQMPVPSAPEDGTDFLMQRIAQQDKAIAELQVGRMTVWPLERHKMAQQPNSRPCMSLF